LIIRTQFYEPIDGEKYFFQQLIKSMPFRSFTELISNINITKTFKEECIIKNLWVLEEDQLDVELNTLKKIDLKDEAIKLFMRNNFASETNKQNSKSYFDENVFNLENNLQETDNIIEEIEDNGQYNLNTYIRINSNLISEINTLEIKLQTLSSDQKEVMDYIKANLDHQMLIFLSGEGGCGKTYLINIINSMMTMNGLTVRKLATTGYAATLIDGQTVHGFFSINYLLKCTIQYDSSKWHIIKQTDVIIIDECSLMSDELLNLLENILSEIYYDQNKNKTSNKFGKKTIILTGDLLQLEAVSTFRKPITQLYKSVLFKDNFKPFILETNMRAIADPLYSDFLTKCRIGEYDFEYIQSRICGEGHALSDECENMFDSVNICALHKNRKQILTNTLDTYFPKQPKIEIKCCDTYVNGTIVSEHITKKISESSGSFEETLVLTKGCKIILIKNINTDFKISNGVEGEYLAHSEFVLLMKTSDGSIIPIPKLKQKIDKLENYNTHVYRTQFPVLLGYAVTVHRVQGATLKKTHLYLDSSIFCEGQAYVSLSRVRNAESVHILKFEKCAFKTNMEIVDLLYYANKFKTMKNYNLNNNIDSKIKQTLHNNAEKHCDTVSFINKI
jgi:ATP-dependent DNA helicase PIF1